jgi:hypothetical protein
MRSFRAEQILLEGQNGVSQRLDGVQILRQPSAPYTIAKALTRLQDRVEIASIAVFPSDYSRQFVPVAYPMFCNPTGMSFRAGASGSTAHHQHTV